MRADGLDTVLDPRHQVVQTLLDGALPVDEASERTDGVALGDGGGRHVLCVLGPAENPAILTAGELMVAGPDRRVVAVLDSQDLALEFSLKTWAPM